MRKASSWSVVLAFVAFAGCGVATTEPQEAAPASSTVEQDVTLDPCHTACRQADLLCIRSCVRDTSGNSDCGCAEAFTECNAACP